jgi:DNA-binding transcriptional ArsR family regulator
MKWIYHHVDRRAGDEGSPVDAYRYQAKVIRALAHPVRLQILSALARQPTCVGELEAMTGRRQSYVSQQLSILRAAGLVRCEKRRQQVCYRLTWPEVAKLLAEVHLVSIRRSELRH